MVMKLSIYLPHGRNRVSIRLLSPPPPPLSRVVATRGYGDPIMIQYMGLDVRITGANFNHVDYWSSEGVMSNGVHRANWSAVTRYQPLGRAEMEYLKSIQPGDHPIEQKMNWLVGDASSSSPSRPYWTLGAAWGGAWMAFRFGTMVFGHSRIRVHANPDGSLKIFRVLTQYKDGDVWRTGELEFLQVDGFKPHMMDKNRYPVEWLLENAYIQQATEAYAGNAIGYEPRGVLYHPVWDVTSYPSNYGTALYIARFCVVEQP